MKKKELEPKAERAIRKKREGKKKGEKRKKKKKARFALYHFGLFGTEEEKIKIQHHFNLCELQIFLPLHLLTRHFSLSPSSFHRVNFSPFCQTIKNGSPTTAGSSGMIRNQ